MEIPAALYGNRRDVKTRVRRVVRELKRSPEIEKLDFGPMMSTTDDRTARFLLNGYLAEGGSHFHVYAPIAALADAKAKGEIDDEVIRKYLLSALESPWRFLGISGQWGSLALFPPRMHHLRRPYLRAALRFFDELESEGVRYGEGVRPVSFSESARGLFPILASEGFPIAPDEPSEHTLELLRVAVKAFDATS